MVTRVWMSDGFLIPVLEHPMFCVARLLKAFDPKSNCILFRFFSRFLESNRLLVEGTRLILGSVDGSFTMSELPAVRRVV